MNTIQVIPSLIPINVEDKLSIIRLMSVSGKMNVSNVDDLVNDIMIHEEEMETDVLPNIALPHAKSGAVNTPFIVIAKHDKGIKWNNSFVKLIIMIAVGKNAEKEHLDIIAKLASNLADDDFIDNLLNEDINTIAKIIRGIYE